MKKQFLLYGFLSLMLFFSVMMVVVITSNKGRASHETNKEVTKTTQKLTTTSAVPTPTFAQTPSSDKIPNPCEMVSIEHINMYVPSVQPRGPLFQDSVDPLKGCEWITINKDYPRLGVTISSSTKYFDNLEQLKTSDLSLGEKAFVIDGFKTGFTGASCGKTIIVKVHDYSITVALCKDNDEKPSDSQLVELATDVINSFSNQHS